MTRRPPRDPKTLVNTHYDRATKTMTIFGEPLMINGTYIPAYENYLKTTLTDINGMYQRFRKESDRIQEMSRDPARFEEADRARRKHFEIVDILYAAEEIIWDRLSQIGVKKA